MVIKLTYVVVLLNSTCWFGGALPVGCSCAASSIIKWLQLPEGGSNIGTQEWLIAQELAVGICQALWSWMKERFKIPALVWPTEQLLKHLALQLNPGRQFVYRAVRGL